MDFAISYNQQYSLTCCEIERNEIRRMFGGQLVNFLTNCQLLTDMEREENTG